MKKIKRLLSLILASTMVLSMTACGGKESEQDRAAMEAVKQGVYKSTELYKSEQSENGDTNFVALGYFNDKIYMVENENKYGTDENGMWYNEMKYSLKSMNIAKPPFEHKNISSMGLASPY